MIENALRQFANWFNIWLIYNFCFSESTLIIATLELFSSVSNFFRISSFFSTIINNNMKNLQEK